MTTPKLTTLIAIGTRGCAMAHLSETQLKALKLNAENALMPKEQRSSAQIVKARKGEWQDSLAYDSRSYITNRNEADTFWIGTLAEALKKGLVKPGVLTLAKGGKVEVFVHAKFDAAKVGFDSYFATQDKLGRIEPAAIGHGEKGRKGSIKNSIFVKAIEAIALKK